VSHDQRGGSGAASVPAGRESRAASGRTRTRGLTGAAWWREGIIGRQLHRCILAGSALLLSACTATSRLEAPAGLPEGAAPAGFAPTIRAASDDWRIVPAAAAAHLRQLRRISRDGRIRILALSGGGAGGAFGAGALAGLSERNERPSYDVVTGVSTGALISPFAFLGPDWDGQLEDAFRGMHSEHLLTARSIDVLFRPSYYRGGRLFNLVDHFVTPELVRAVAQEAARGRLLLVATTDLDKEEPVIWNLGAIAARGGEDARVLFRDVLLASASIPGLLPPVVVHVRDGQKRYDELHVDGATTVPFFILPESVLLSNLPRDLLEGGEIYVLINGQLSSVPHTTEIRTLPIVSRSLSASLRHQARSELALTAVFAAHYGMQFRFATLPIDHAPVNALDLGAENMGQLYAYGRNCAERGLLWTTVDQAESSGELALRKAAGGAATDGYNQDVSCPLDESLVLGPLADAAVGK
jgi:hypothetical protein